MLDIVVLYKNYRAHAVFNDQTSVILHPGYEHFTYFDQGGHKIKQGYTLTTDGDLQNKLSQIISVANSVIDAPVPILAEKLYEGVINSPNPLDAMEFKLPGRAVVVDTQGSVTKQISIASGPTVPFYRQTDGAISMEAEDGWSSVTLSSDAMLLNVNFPMLMNRSIGCCYAILSQVYSTAAIPSRWRTLASLLYRIHIELGGWKRDEIPWFSQNDDEILNTIHIPIPTAVKAIKWIDDDLAPSQHLYSYAESDYYVVWTLQATYRKFQQNIEILLHDTQTTLVWVGLDYLCQATKRFDLQSVPERYQYAVNICKNLVPPKTRYVRQESMVENVGRFTAFNDNSIQAIFDDKTVVWMQDSEVYVLDHGRKVRMSNRLSRIYGKYMPICKEFQAWAFTEPFVNQAIAQQYYENQKQIQEIHDLLDH